MLYYIAYAVIQALLVLRYGANSKEDNLGMLFIISVGAAPVVTIGLVIGFASAFIKWFVSVGRN
jgi:K+-sensing histidine kinase KdpD